MLGSQAKDGSLIFSRAQSSRVEIRGSVTIELEPLFDTGFS